MLITESHLLKYSSSNYISEAVRNKYFTAKSQYINESVNKSTVFLSHKHDDIVELKRIIDLLEKQGSGTYLDWMDEEMPKKTCAATATKIKNKIKECRKFILVATEGAINSKWCNWELGQGDILKYSSNIAVFPIKKDYSDFTGNEYLEIYPIIEMTERSGSYIYYISFQGKFVCLLKEWLS